jgi:hypothetical protein
MRVSTCGKSRTMVKPRAGWPIVDAESNRFLPDHTQNAGAATGFALRHVHQTRLRGSVRPRPRRTYPPFTATRSRGAPKSSRVVSRGLTSICVGSLRCITQGSGSESDATATTCGPAATNGNS